MAVFAGKDSCALKQQYNGNTSNACLQSRLHKFKLNFKFNWPFNLSNDQRSFICNTMKQL